MNAFVSLSGCRLTLVLAGWLSLALPLSAQAVDPPAAGPRVKHQIAGLFCPERVDDFRQLCAEKLARFKLVSVDYERAEATFEYDPAREFPGANPTQVIERFDNELRNVSKHTFGAKPLRVTPDDKLQRVELSIEGLDCKACSLACYEIIARLNGVEQATASFKTKTATALIDPAQISRAEIEAALRQRGVTVK